MKILVISSYLPYPLFSGGHVRLYNLIKNISKNHEITMVCEKRDYQTIKDIEEVKKICKDVKTIERKKQWTLFNILKTLFSSYPFLLIGHKNNDLKKEIEKLLAKEKFDLVHIETFYVMHNLPIQSIGNLPLVLAEHNVEYLVYKRFAQTSNLLLRPLFLLDVAKMKYWEEKYWQKATKLVAVSKEEKALMKRDDVEIVPNGVDLEKFKSLASRRSGQKSKVKIESEEKRILFIGDFRWVQNRDSVKWILKKIWPLLRSEVGSEKLETNLKLWVVGREIPDSIKKITNDEDVIFDENASEETSEIFKNADILLAPTRVGGGTSYKILEAMASGVAVVTTSLGIEGIEAENKKDVLIADKAEDIAGDVLKLLGDNDLYVKIIQSARKLIEEKYDWKIITKKLEEAYQSAAT